MKPGENKILIKTVTWLIRLLVGGLFIFSGFVKAIDPWGTLFKVNDYLGAFSIELWHNLKLSGVFFLCALEFVTGVFFVTGSFRKSWPVIGLLIMIFMLPLTFWIALRNPVADCGCFGDALILSNWVTFWKNVILTLGIIWLLFYNRTVGCVITPALQWLEFVVSSVFIFIIAFFGYNYQPLIDFRNFPIGSMLTDVQETDSGPEYQFIYEKEGEKKIFTLEDEIPEEGSGWKFLYRNEIYKDVEEKKVQKNGIRLFDKIKGEDETSEAIISDGKELIIMMPDLSKVSPATTWKLNSLSEWSELNDVKMIGVVSGSPSEIEEWEDLSMPGYPIYISDDTKMKEIVRGNPGVVYLKDGIIEWKSSLAAIDIDDFMSPGTSRDADSFEMDNESILFNYIALYLAVMAVLVILSFTPKITGLIMGNFHKKHHMHISRHDRELPEKKDSGQIKG